MSWSPAPETDAEIREWMKDQGWAVTTTHYDFRREIYAWRNEAPGDSHTLRVTQAVLEDHPAAELIGHLNRLHVADLISGNPRNTLVRRSGGSVVAVALD
jgi:hypothetical protein